MCRTLYDQISSAKTWSSYVVLNVLSIFQLNWWVENLSNVSEYPISFDTSLVTFIFSIAGDASDTGF